MMRRYVTVSLYALLTGAILSGWAPAHAQTSQQGAKRPSHIPNPSKPGGPFGSDWAKPGGTTGSYIYDDPRLRSPYRTHPRRGVRCPAPSIYDPGTGACR